MLNTLSALNTRNVSATLAVSDLGKAKEFYEGVLGLEAVEDSPHEVVYQSGNSQVSVYPSGFAGTNKATAATWAVDDVESAVDELKGKGVTFEHYDDMEGVTLDGDVHVMGDMRAAWFKDPDGNILCLHS
jgi:catechol 2,3-dioxygenase-like lactoylglutathione lyase family enzyme